MTPHPYRCETCGRARKLIVPTATGEPFEFWYCPITKKFLHDEFIRDKFMEFALLVGCASHTSAPGTTNISAKSTKLVVDPTSEAAIRASERERVTEWLFQQFKEFTDEKYKFGDDWLADWWIERVGYLRTPEGEAALRRAGGEPK